MASEYLSLSWRSGSGKPIPLNDTLSAGHRLARLHGPQELEITARLGL